MYWNFSTMYKHVIILLKFLAYLPIQMDTENVVILSYFPLLVRGIQMDTAHKALYVGGILFFLCALPVFAQATKPAPLGLKNNAPIQIQSDKASVEQINHQAIHEGNV